MSSSEGGGGGGDERRPVRDMQSLLKFCVQESGSSSEDNTVRSTPMDPQRKAWLEEAIKNMSVDVVQEMLKAIELIKHEIDYLHRDEERENDEAVEKILNSVDGITDRIQDLDLAADFHKIGGFDILPLLLESPHNELKMKGAELVGELVQNHAYCQKAAIDMDVLDILVKILDNNSLPGNVKVKALFAVSCLIRNNPGAQDRFEKLDGYSVLLRVMQQDNNSEASKLRTKSAFLLTSIIQEWSGVKQRLFRMGYIEQFVGLLHMEHDSSHEHLFSALLGFISGFDEGIKECQRAELQVKTLVKNRLELLKGKEEHLKEVEYCHGILNLCFEEETETTGTTATNTTTESNDTDR